MKKWIIAGMLFVGSAVVTACGNMDMWDTQYTFDKAITTIGGEVVVLEVKQWRSYEGEQLQIKTKDGKTYLLSSFNTVLVDE